MLRCGSARRTAVFPTSQCSSNGYATGSPPNVISATPIAATESLPRRGQAQQPPPQQPPEGADGGLGVAAAPPRLTVPNVVSSLTVSAWPLGQDAGADDSAIGRFISKVSPQLRHR